MVAGPSNVLLTRRVEELSQQVADLVALVQTTHQSQMAMERSLRQEVAAALHGNSPQALSTSAPASTSRPAVGNNCVVCLQAQANTIMYRCGHLCACTGCAAKILVSAFQQKLPPCSCVLLAPVCHLLFCLNKLTALLWFGCAWLCFQEDGLSCPCCRAPVVDVLRAYTP